MNPVIIHVPEFWFMTLNSSVIGSAQLPCGQIRGMP
jgi:hypothetical protein